MYQNNGSSQVPGLFKHRKKEVFLFEAWKRLMSHIKFVHFPCFLGFPSTPYRTCRLQNGQLLPREATVGGCWFFVSLKIEGIESPRQ